MDFYQGATLLGTVTNPPYTVTVNNLGQGSYSFTAVATDNAGATTTSSPVAISVTPGQAQVYYIYSDQLNTPRVITDQTNKVVWRWDETDPFGANVPNDDPNNTGSHFSFNPRFPGQYFDSETNTHYNYFRDYDPGSGRFRQSDRIGLRGGINTYAYANNAPTMYTDPKGTNPLSGALGGAEIGGAIGGPVGAVIGGIIGFGAGVYIASQINDAVNSSSSSSSSSSPSSTCKPDDECEKLLRIDTDTCNAITRRRGGAAGAACHASAAQRYAACLRGQPLPPLNTWNN